jgi:hypothetical protein
MCVGVALVASELPLCLHERVHLRGGEREVRFLWRHRPRVLPAWHEGRIILNRWGGKRGEELPSTGWGWLSTLEAGGWAPWQPEQVDIPATYCLDGGVWYRVRHGVRALLVRDAQGGPVVYVLCEPSSHYYQVMTRSERMPVLIDERI